MLEPHFSIANTPQKPVSEGINFRNLLIMECCPTLLKVALDPILFCPALISIIQAFSVRNAS